MLNYRTVCRIAYTDTQPTKYEIRATNMKQTLIYKILAQHLAEGRLGAGQQIGIRIDQTLTQDATGTTAFLLYESMGAEPVKTELSVSYIDHNMAGFGPENHNDHLYLQTIAAKCSVNISRAGNNRFCNWS